MATHFNILAWKIPWTDKPGGLQSTGEQSQARLNNGEQAQSPPGLLSSCLNPVVLGIHYKLLYLGFHIKETACNALVCDFICSDSSM